MNNGITEDTIEDLAFYEKAKSIIENSQYCQNLYDVWDIDLKDYLEKPQIKKETYIKEDYNVWS